MGRDTLNRLTTEEPDCKPFINLDLYETDQVHYFFVTPCPLEGCRSMWDFWFYIDDKMKTWNPKINYPFS